MPPSIATYQQAAQQIYEPQKAADITQAGATRDITKSTLAAEKPQIEADYQLAVDDLTKTTNENVGKINQFYTLRLGGNFSGLQGNDLGMMFSSAGKQQALIGTTRANKLTAITTGMGNADIKYGADVQAISGKYQGEEANYAQSSYGAAVKDYNTNQVAIMKANASAAKAAASAVNKRSSQFKVTGKKGDAGTADFSNGYSFTGPNGKPVNMSEYISGADLGGQDVVDLLQNGSSYDRSIATKLAKDDPQSDTQLLGLLRKYDTGHYYGF